MDELQEVRDITEQTLRHLVDRVDHETWQQGMVWYQNAHAYARQIGEQYGYSIDQTAWALALLSPQNRWAQNKADLVELIETGDCGALPLGTGRAALTLSGEAVGEEIAGGNKVRAFGHNIRYPHNSADVTLDTWMISALGITDARYLERRGIYHAISDAFRKVAEDHGIMPHQLQATLWIHTRGEAE